MLGELCRHEKASIKMKKQNIGEDRNQSKENFFKTGKNNKKEKAENKGEKDWRYRLMDFRYGELSTEPISF